MVFKFERKSTEKKCEKRKNGAYYGKNSVIIETFLNVCANSGRCSLFFRTQMTRMA